MRILICNKFWYRRGGDCIYAINLAAHLRARGHEVAEFAMQHPDNIPSEWASFFPSQVDFRFGSKLLENALRPMGSPQVKRKFNAILDAFKPDVVQLNNIHSQLSPVLAQIAHSRGIRVVWTLHDYKLLCPRYDCLQNGLKVCEECFADKRNVLRHKCMKNSAIASRIAYREAMKWNREVLSEYTDAFVCPSSFLASKMEGAGFPESKIHVLCNFIGNDCTMQKPAMQGDYICYVGRMSHEKGVRMLVEAMRELPDVRLLMLGKGPMFEELSASAPSNVEFLGYKNWDEMKEIVSGARFSIIPSGWYENNPLSVIESLCLGTPVLGAISGGIPELITTEEDLSAAAMSDEPVATDAAGHAKILAPVATGMTFDSSSAALVRDAIKAMLPRTFDRAAISASSLQRFSADKYMDAMESILRG